MTITVRKYCTRRIFHFWNKREEVDAMKKYCLVLLILLGLMGLYGCGAGSSESDDEGSSGIRELTENETVTADIETEGDVDWYSFNAVEVNRTLSVNCSGTYGNSPVDFMMTIYEQDDDGNMVPLFGRSAAEDAALAADLEILVAIDEPKQIYIAVRDFLDDDASDRIHYELEAHYTTDATDTGTFAQAQEIEVDAATCQYDSISQIGEVNTYRFDIETEGVYQLIAQYNVSDTSTVDVNLGIELYDDTGQLVYQYKGSRPSDLSYAVLVHLVSGSYFVVIDDQGRNDTDTANYTICVNSVSVSEMAVNDALADAQENTPDADGYVLDGTLEYYQDEDWYLLDVPEASGTAFQNIIIQFARDMTELPDSLSQLTYPGTYQITLQDSEGNVLHQFSQSVTVSDTYSVQIAAGIGEQHYITVQPVIGGQMVEALPYQLRVQLVEVNDENENGDEVTVLDPAGETVTGKISTLADVDKFQISVDNTTQPKVVELYFDTTEASMVDYSLYVQLPDEDLPYVITDTNGSENGADEGDHFKTSYYLPAGATSASEIDIDVRDHQNNDGSDVEYTLTVDVLDVPTGSLPTVSGIVTTTPVYNSEPAERADSSARTVTVVEYDSEGQPEFQANTTLLNVDALDSNNQWQSEWIAGFVDYDGDRDLYQLIVDDITQAEDAPEEWYFDIQVEFYAAASTVEYGWALFRDRQPNDVLLERTFWGDTSGTVYEYDTDAEGIIACWSDMEIAQETQHITIPRAEDGDFWIGYGWSSSRYYFSIQDFNRANESVTYDSVSESYVATPNQVPDNDWGNTNSSPTVAPYYFQVTVTFHPGCETPDDTECTP